MASKPRHDDAKPGGTVRVGMSGWTYVPWRGTFYPAKLPQKNELSYAAAQLSSIEINGTFYGLQKPKSFANWYEQTPGGFVFSVKAPKFITHVRKLRDVEGAVANSLLSGVLRLNEKLGPVLWQLPPSLEYDPPTFEAFLRLLPHTTREAAGRLDQCDARMRGRTWAEIDVDRPLRHAVEVRNAGFATEAFVRLLREHNVAIVTADTDGGKGGGWPQLHDVTADFAYLRLHGIQAAYKDGYTDAGLADWAKHVNTVAGGGEPAGDHRVGPKAVRRAKRDVYVYFDDETKIRSPFDAARLSAFIGGRATPIDEATPRLAEVPSMPEWRGRPD